jgi:hypothetical protein
LRWPHKSSSLRLQTTRFNTASYVSNRKRLGKWSFHMCAVCTRVFRSPRFSCAPLSTLLFQSFTCELEYLFLVSSLFLSLLKSFSLSLSLPLPLSSSLSIVSSSLLLSVSCLFPSLPLCLFFFLPVSSSHSLSLTPTCTHAGAEVGSLGGRSLVGAQAGRCECGETGLLRGQSWGWIARCLVDVWRLFVVLFCR